MAALLCLETLPTAERSHRLHSAHKTGLDISCLLDIRSSKVYHQLILKCFSLIASLSGRAHIFT